MKTLKENLYDIIKLFVNQFGIGIFALFLYTAVGVAFVENDELFNIARILVSVFSIGFYMVLVYYMFWEIGAKDGIRISGGRMAPEPKKALIMGLFANLPNLFVAFLSLLFLLIYRASGSEAMLSTFKISFMIETWLLDMYMGVVQGITPAVSVDGSFEFVPALIQSILYLIAPLLISVSTVHFSYSLGLKDKKLFSRKTRS